MGEKPLYYGVSGDTLLFGSELKSLAAHPAWRGEIDERAAALFLRYRYVPSPYSIYKDIHKLPPATSLTVDIERLRATRRLPEPAGYWDLAATVAPSTSADANQTVLVDQLDELLRGAVLSQMEADVPLGAFLSGGVDSTTIVALMQAQSPRPVKTFTIGFEESNYNEADHARGVAAYLGTDHTEMVVTSRDALDVIPSLPEICDEPLADVSQIPTYLVSKLARENVTVSLSGDGGDELFCGYRRHTFGADVWRRIRPLPHALRGVAAGLISACPPSVLNTAFGCLGPMLRRSGGVRSVSDQLYTMASLLTARSPQQMYQRLVGAWSESDLSVLDSLSAAPEHLLGRGDEIGDARLLMSLLDMSHYLPDDILTKVDRASMAVSLESRAPLLDHRVVEFAGRLPMEAKIHDGKGKWILREVMNRYVPRQMVERPKQGFSAPIGRWLRGPLREWAEELLSPESLADCRIAGAALIRRRWEQHLAGGHNWEAQLWNVLTYSAWRQAIGRRIPVRRAA